MGYGKGKFASISGHHAVLIRHIDEKGGKTLCLIAHCGIKIETNMLSTGSIVF
jgi:hypothetical protein